MRWDLIGPRVASVVAALAWALAGAANAAPAKPSRLGLCAACHGENGRATVSGYPHIQGQDETYLLAQLRAYKDGSRSHPQMRAAVGSLNDVQLRELARWYASMEPCHVQGQQQDR